MNLEEERIPKRSPNDIQHTYKTTQDSECTILPRIALIFYNRLFISLFLCNFAVDKSINKAIQNRREI